VTVVPPFLSVFTEPAFRFLMTKTFVGPLPLSRQVPVRASRELPSSDANQKPRDRSETEMKNSTRDGRGTTSTECARLSRKRCIDLHIVKTERVLIPAEHKTRWTRRQHERVRTGNVRVPRVQQPNSTDNGMCRKSNTPCSAGTR